MDGVGGFFELPLERVAVLLVDFQNDFCSPDACRDGVVTNRGNAAAARRADQFARRAAAQGAHVIYTRQVLDLDRLTARQRRWERPDGLCAAGSWGAELFLEPVPGAEVVIKDRFDCWRSHQLCDALARHAVDGLVIGGVELVCCVLYAVLGADERGYHYLVPPDLVSGQDTGEDTDNRAVRDFLRFNQPERVRYSSAQILARWGVP